MKIIYGKFKRRTLIVGDNQKMRPTQSMTKSKIFNIIDINENDCVVDLFAGTGALGFESASLGASKVLWNDNNAESYKAIDENISLLQLDPNKFKVFKNDFRMVLKKLPFKATIIFLDPPYTVESFFEESLKLISENKVLDKNGVVILEKPYKLFIPSLSKYIIIDNRKIGRSDLLMLKLKNEK